MKANPTEDTAKSRGSLADCKPLQQFQSGVLIRLGWVACQQLAATCRTSNPPAARSGIGDRCLRRPIDATVARPYLYAWNGSPDVGRQKVWSILKEPAGLPLSVRSSVQICSVWPGRIRQTVATSNAFLFYIPGRIEGRGNDSANEPWTVAAHQAGRNHDLG